MSHPAGAARSSGNTVRTRAPEFSLPERHVGGPQSACRDGDRTGSRPPPELPHHWQSNAVNSPFVLSLSPSVCMSVWTLRKRHVHADEINRICQMALKRSAGCFSVSTTDKSLGRWMLSPGCMVLSSCGPTVIFFWRGGGRWRAGCEGDIHGRPGRDHRPLGAYCLGVTASQFS